LRKLKKIGKLEKAEETWKFGKKLKRLGSRKKAEEP
jgi:hypothetical protein